MVEAAFVVGLSGVCSQVFPRFCTGVFRVFALAFSAFLFAAVFYIVSVLPFCSTPVFYIVSLFTMVELSRVSRNDKLWRSRRLRSACSP